MKFILIVDLEFYEKLFDAFKIGNWDSDKIKYYLPYLVKNLNFTIFKLIRYYLMGKLH